MINSKIENSNVTPLFGIPFLAKENACFGSDPNKSEYRQKIFGEDLKGRSNIYLDTIRNRSSVKQYVLQPDCTIRILEHQSPTNKSESPLLTISLSTSTPQKGSEGGYAQTSAHPGTPQSERPVNENLAVEVPEVQMVVDSAVTETVAANEKPIESAIIVTEIVTIIPPELIPSESQIVELEPVIATDPNNNEEANMMQLSQSEDLQPLTFQIEGTTMEAYLQQMEPGCTSNQCPMVTSLVF